MKNKVKDHRVEQNLTQEELAKKANVSRCLISRIENGDDINITKNTMLSIAEALNSNVSDIFLF